MEKAFFSQDEASWLNRARFCFAENSLSEFSPLAALAEVIPIESLASVMFYPDLNTMSLSGAILREEAITL